MRRTALRTHAVPRPPRASNSIAQRLDALAEALEDPESESSMDYDDEREAIEVIAPGALRSVN